MTESNVSTSSHDKPLTKDRILDAAERLFAEHGFEATSLRMITTEAEVNLAAVNYHFHSKDELIAAVFARRIGPINQKRLDSAGSAARRRRKRLRWRWRKSFERSFLQYCRAGMLRMAAARHRADSRPHLLRPLRERPAILLRADAPGRQALHRGFPPGVARHAPGRTAVADPLRRGRDGAHPGRHAPPSGDFRGTLRHLRRRRH